MRPESMHPGHRLSWIAIAVLAFVPLLAAAMLLSLTRGGRTTGIEAAVVNLDQAVTVGDQVMPLGRQLAAEMVDREGENISWTLADEADAEAGLAEGRYAAVVVIPEGFSAAATSASSNDPEKVHQATVGVTVAENAAVSDAVLAQEIAALATESLNRTVTTAYLENIYVGFNTVSDQFETVVETTQQLNAGGAELSDGITQAADGSQQLAEGMNTLAAEGTALETGAQQLASGSDELAEGANTLAAGTGTLSEGASALAEGVAQLNSQTPQLVTGVNQLTVGAEQLLGAIPGYTNGTVSTLDGVVQLRDGLAQVEAGVSSQIDPQQLAAVQAAMSKLVPGLRDLQAAVSVYFPGVDATTVTVEQLRAAAAQLDQQLSDTEAALAALAQGTGTPPAEVEAFAQQLIAGYQCPVADPDTCQLLAQAYAQGVTDAVSKGFQAGAQAAQSLLNTTDSRTGQTPLEASRSLTSRALVVGEALIELRDAMSSGVPAGTDPLTALEQLPTQLGAQLTSLGDSITQLRTGADTLLTQAQPLRDNATTLNSGATDLLTGMQSLNSTVASLPAGTSQLAAGSSQLATGTSDLASGTSRLSLAAQQLADGSETLSAGVSAYVDGVDQASTATDELSTGMTALGDGAGELSNGLNQFHQQLAEAAKQLPSYDEQDRATLANTLASPVAQSVDPAQHPLVPIGALITVVALWLGAMLVTAVVAPVPSDVVSSSRSTVALWLRTLAVPTVLGVSQGLLLGLVVGWALKLPLLTMLAAAVVLALLGVSFAVVNHALVAWLGNAGRGLAVLLLVATVGIGLTSQLPQWLEAAAAVSPLHNGLLLARTVMAQGAGEVALAGGALLFFGIATAASYLALATRRRLTATQFRRRIATAS